MCIRDSFLGKPIIAYPIEAALKSNLFEEVVVSTDDEEIASIAEKYGAKALYRSTENSDDFSTLFQVVKEVLTTSYTKDKMHFETVSCILATNAFVTPVLLQKAHKFLTTEIVDSILPVIPFSYPIQSCLLYTSPSPRDRG